MISPEQYDQTPVYDLLREASEGRLGIDQRWIGSIINRRDDAIPALLKWGLEEHEEAPSDLTQELMHLFLYFNTPEAVPYLIHELKFDPTDVPDEIVEALYKQRHAALEPLLALYNELEEDQAGEVAFILASFRIHDERVLKILLDRLEYDAGDGAISLGVYGDEAARPALEKLAAEVGDSDPPLKSDITSAIEQLGSATEEPVDEPFDILSFYPKLAPPHFDMLSEDDRLLMLKSESASFRAQAVSSFINRDLTDRSRDALFKLAKADPDEDVRGTAWEALSAVADENDEIRDAMLARLSDRSVPKLERAGALIGLAFEAGRPEVRTYVEEFYHDEETRAKALECMWRSFDKTFGEYMPAHLDDEDEEIRRAAVWGVGYLNVSSAADRLVPFFEEEDLRGDALFAYALAARHETSKSRLPGLFRRIEELAAGLSPAEVELVQLALDERMMMNGHKPVYFPMEEDEERKPIMVADEPGRNDPCFCGSGKKYKKCHGAPV